MATPNSTNAPPEGCCPNAAVNSNINSQSELLLFSNDSRREILELGYPGFVYSVHHMRMATEAIYWNLYEITPVDTWENFFLVTTLHDTQLITEPQRNINALDDVLSNFSSSPKYKHLSIMTSVDGKSWIAVFLSKVIGNLRVLFFDPCGNQLCEELRLKIEDQMKDYQVEIATHAQDPNTHMPPIGTSDTGPICLRYVEMILLKMGEGTDVSAFMRSKSLFQVLAELNLLPHQYEEEILEIRERFQQQYYLQHATSALSMLIHTQSKFQEFKEDFSNFLEEQISPIDAKKHFVYLECLEMLESSEAQNDSSIQDKTLINKIEAAREAVEESFFVRQMEQKGAILAENFTEDVGLCGFKDKGFKNMSAKYEQNFLSDIFVVLQVCSSYKSIISRRVKEEVCSLLGFNHSQLDQMLQTDENPLLTNIVPGSLSNAKDISSLVESYNNLRPNDVQHEIISESEVTTESLNKFREAFLEENRELVVDPQLVDQLVTVHEYIYSSSNKWRKASASEIYNWAWLLKGKSIKADILEIIASLDRANEIITNGQRLELDQIFSLIILGSSESSTGKISQIHVDEESKTKIIAMLAIAKILRGEPAVDIITRSSAFADKAVRDNVNFYKMFQIHAAANNPDINEETVQETNGLNKCYLADVVYGTIKTFQMDYLQDIWGTRRGNRGFGVVILDNVDCMLLEDSVCIPTLVSTFPGMEILRYVYAEIWTSLLSLEDSYPKELRKILLGKSFELNEAQDRISLAERIRRYKDIRLEKQSEIYKNIHAEIKKGLKYWIKVPNHLIDFVESSLENWVNSAILIMYKFRENEDYYLKPVKGKEPSIVPIYGKGIENTFESTIWTHEMYQFVQLKHNLKLTQDELTTGRISTYGYINLYGENILGLTCTLGSSAEQDLLRKMYNVDLSCIPGPKSRQFLEIKGRVISDINWAKTVAIDSCLLAKESRPVLIICKTIEECQNVADCLKIKESITQQTEKIAAEEPGMYEFRPVHKIIEADVTVLQTITLHPADIVVTTDSAVRSISFCLSEDLKSTQGKQLHVCIGFCPKTEREKQSLFRIAGFKNGTAQMIVRLSEIQTLKICPEAEQSTNVEEDTSSESSSSADISAVIEHMHSYNPDEEYDPVSKICFDQTDDSVTESCLPENNVAEESIPSVIEDEKFTLHEQVLQIRDFWNLEPYKKHLCDFEVINVAIIENETQWWKNLSDAILPKLYLEDQLFHQYWSHHQSLHFQNISNVTFQFLLKDVQEFWSIWLSNIDFTEAVNLAKSDSRESCSESENNHWETLKSKLYIKSRGLFSEYQELAVGKGMVCGPFTGDFQIIQKTSENIYRNPYYGIQEADFHSRLGNSEKAFECVGNVVKMASDDNEMVLFSAHMKKFCTAVHWKKDSRSDSKNGAAMALMKNKFENLDMPCKKDAKQALTDAQKYVDLQMKNLQGFINQYNQSLPLLVENLSKTTLFVQLETPKLNLTEFLNSEVLSLQLNASLINELLKCIDSTDEEISPEINLCSFSTLVRPGSEKWIQIFIQNESKLELELFGLSLLQYLKASQGIQKPQIDSSPCNKIAEGLVALLSTSFIPLASAFSISVGSVLIFKGFNDIVLLLLEESSEHEAAVVINLINAGILQLVSEDLEVNLRTMEILFAAAKSCQFVTSKFKSLPKYQLLDGLDRLVFSLEKLSNFLSRVLHMMKFRTNEENHYNNKSKVIQTRFSLASSLEKATGSQKVIEERIMERHESVYVKEIFEDAKDFAIAVVRRKIEDCKGQIKYVDETKFLKSLVDDLEKPFENTWRAMTEIISLEIKEKYRNIHDPSNNFFGGFQKLLFDAVVNMTSKLEYVLMVCVNFIPGGDFGLANFDELFKWRVQFVIEKINNYLSTVDTAGKPFAKACTEEDAPNFATVTSAETEAEDDVYHELLDEIQREIVKKFQFTFTQADQLQNIQVAYMILTAEQVLESECLEKLRNGNSLPMEELQIILKSSFCTMKLNDAGLSKTAEESRNSAIQILEERLQKNIRWHQNIQWKYSKCLGGAPSFDVSDVQRQTEQEQLSGSRSEGDIESDTVTSESENYNQETHGTLVIAEAVKSAQTLSRHSSPKRGLEYLIKEKISIGETLSTFLDLSSQVKAMNVCLRQIESELAPLFRSPGGCSRCEVHVDITQLSGITFDMCEITLSKDDRGNTVENSRFSKARFITLILGHRPPQKFYNTKRLFYVESVFPRTEVPGGLRGDAPYNITIICN